MARLNEPAPQLESVDALKRRFIRQNREISRVNSTQSLRIRNLEAEISRLLAENIAVREDAIRSAQEAERLRSAQRIFKDVSRLKEQLESKLVEVGTLVTEMGTLPEKARRRSSQHQRKRSGLVESKTSPDQSQRKSRLSLGGLVAAERHLQEGRLPIIAEGKPYPRKTLESLEINHLVGDGLQPDESPELGPPPIAHFDVTEPVNDTSDRRGSTHTSFDPGKCFQNHEDDIKPLPENLERRRKRRASGLIEDLPTDHTVTPRTATALEHGAISKLVAKRDFNTYEDTTHRQFAEGGLDVSEPVPKSITLENPQPRPRSSRFSKPGGTAAKEVAPIKDHTPILESAPRQALGPKSTNSPSKVKGKQANLKLAPTRDDVVVKARPDAAPKSIATKAMKARLSPKLDFLRVQEVKSSRGPERDDSMPGTPADMDLVSPASTEPSARAQHPIEAALSASVEDILGGTDGRTSRRAKGTVSYVEPSLRAKMRRPTKEFIPAVAEQSNGIKAQTQRESSMSRDASLERHKGGDSSFLKTRKVTSKSESSHSSSNTTWSGRASPLEEPASPLVNKAGRSLTAKPSLPLGTEESGGPTREDDPTTEVEKALENLTVFDGPGCSLRDNESPDTIVVQSRKSISRCSSNSSALRRVAQEFDKSPLLETSQKKGRVGKATRDSKPRQRPSSAASIRKETATQNEEMIDLKRSASVSRLIRSSAEGADMVISIASDTVGIAEDGGDGGAGVISGRPERLAARRSSMMF